MEASSARLANWVRKTQMRKGSASSPNRLVEAHEERALAPGPDGALRRRREEGVQKSWKFVDFEAEPQPGEIVRANQDFRPRQ